MHFTSKKPRSVLLQEVDRDPQQGDILHQEGDRPDHGRETSGRGIPSARDERDDGLWELAGSLIGEGVNPDKLSHEAMVAELTNHLATGAVLTPGMAATIPEFQQAGYHYIK